MNNFEASNKADWAFKLEATDEDGDVIFTDAEVAIAVASGDVSPDATADIYIRTGLTAAAAINAPTGTPTGGEKIIFRLKDDGTSRALTWNAIFRAIGVTIPTATTISKTTYVGAIYNATDTKWDVIAVATEA